MNGNMMDRPLLVSGILEHALATHPRSEIISRRCEGDIHRSTIAECGARAQRLANALQQLGIVPGDRIATLAWNTHRHFEIYFGGAGMGAVVHTINPRLFPDQLRYIITHAEDSVLFVDLSFVPLVEALAPELPPGMRFVVLCDEPHMPDTPLQNLYCYEALLREMDASFIWPELDERSAAFLCYTSGTTGNPKGVLYSHRSTVIHAMASVAGDALGIDSQSCVLPVVPMFHVNAWGTPFACAMTGAKMVLPGPGMDGASLWEMIDAEQPDLLLGVPTVWLMLLNHMDEIGRTLTSVKNVVVGGSAAPLSMIQRFDEDHDAFLIHAWGMTEMSPIGTVNSMTKDMAAMPKLERYALQQKQGRPVYGVEMKIVDDAGTELPRDGKAFGHLLVRGPWIAASYYRSDERSSFQDGWFDTGDVATIDPDNYLCLVDRAKDVIKSGGEWISSIDLENAAVGHPALQECCVIGVAHKKWDERPLLLAVVKEGVAVDESAVLAYLGDKVAKWWLPDAVVFVDALPHTATGKLLKTGLRQEYHDFLLNRVSA